MTYPVEHCGADGFDNEVVIQTQFLQVLVKVIWIQINNLFSEQFLCSHQPTVRKGQMKTECCIQSAACDVKKLIKYTF